MNSTYCPSCGASNQYLIDKPKVCTKCGVAFANAFKVDVSKFLPETTAEKSTSPLYRPSRHNIVRPTRLRDENEKIVRASEEDFYDEDELFELKDEIIASIDPDSFFAPIGENPDIITLHGERDINKLGNE